MKAKSKLVYKAVISKGMLQSREKIGLKQSRGEGEEINSRGAEILVV